MRADDRALADVAASVADGEPVNWAAAEARLPAADRRLARHLRLVEDISTLYRTLPPLEGAAGLAAGAPADPALRRWGTLVLLEKIGEGTTGEVHRAFDSRLHRDVALKLLHHDRLSRADAQERVLEEARRLARLRHEHVVSVYGAEEHDGRVGLWMELVRGESLEARVRAHGPVGADEAARIGQQISAALTAVHASGLLHRDVKAQNVIQESSGRIVLMDFGTGEELRRAQGTTRMVGTPLYLAPEIFKGHAATVQSDIYSVGVLLFYLVTGEFPVKAASMLDLGRAHGGGERRRLGDLRPDLPSAFVDVVDRALDPVPERRFRTAGGMEAALGAARAGTELGAAAAARAGMRWWRKPLAAAAALLLVATVALIVWTRSGWSGAATAGVQRIAVLPLVDTSSQPLSPHVADALTAELIAALGQETNLQVASRSAIARFKDPSEPATGIAAKLAVDGIVQGDLTVKNGTGSDSMMQMDVRLVSAGGGALWNRTFTARLGDAIDLQTEIARSIGGAVHATREIGAERPARQPRSVNEQATAAYLLGRYHLGQGGIERTRQALAAFQRAIDLHSDYAAAHAAAARCHLALGFFGDIPHTAARPQTLAAATRALELDPSTTEALVALADLKFYYDRNWSGAEADYTQVLALNPSFTLARTQYARFLAALGRLDEAVLHAQDAVNRDTMAPEAAQTLGLIRYYQGDYERALEALKRALALDDGHPRAAAVMGRVYDALGRPRDAIAETARAIDLIGDAPVSWHLQLIRLHAIAGNRKQAGSELEAKLREAEAQGRHVAAEHIGYVYLALGERSRALTMLERAVDAYDPGVLWFGVDPRLSALREDSRFIALLRRLQLPD